MILSSFFEHLLYSIGARSSKGFTLGSHNESLGLNWTQSPSDLNHLDNGHKLYFVGGACFIITAIRTNSFAFDGLQKLLFLLKVNVHL